jgi:hypothetical protein
MEPTTYRHLPPPISTIYDTWHSNIVVDSISILLLLFVINMVLKYFRSCISPRCDGRAGHDCKNDLKTDMTCMTPAVSMTYESHDKFVDLSKCPIKASSSGLDSQMSSSRVSRSRPSSFLQQSSTQYTVDSYTSESPSTHEDDTIGDHSACVRITHSLRYILILKFSFVS